MGLFFYLTSPINSIRCHKSYCENYYLVGREYEASIKSYFTVRTTESDSTIIEFQL
ncbi:17846_t:CDS:2 [Rhizophagus irregularis]|nr:17846_t:CDS:2 [Rhizophagus irregularis]